jgi:hypothetical protein
MIKVISTQPMTRTRLGDRFEVEKVYRDRNTGKRIIRLKEVE